MRSDVKEKKRLGDVRLNLTFFIDCFCFLSILLIGADRWGFSVFDVNIRFDQIILCVFAILLIAKRDFRLTMNLWILAFAVFSLLSAILAYDFSRGLLFYLSVCYNIIFLFYLFANYVSTYGIGRFVNIWRKTCYVLFFLLLIQFLLRVLFDYQIPILPSYGEFKGIARFQIWFYEPSYLATYLSVWFAVSFYMWLIKKRNDYLIDIFFALAMFIISASTSGFLAALCVIVFVYFIWLAKGITLKKISFFFLFLLVFIVLLIVFHNVFTVFLGRLFNSSLNNASGGRVEGWRETFDVFLRNPFFGVGVGNYGIYLKEGTEYVPSNVTLDLMATLGIFGTIAFYGLTISLIIRAFKVSRGTPNRDLIRALALGLLIFTIILQINQGYLRLYHWMYFGVVWGGILTDKNLQQKNLKELK